MKRLVYFSRYTRPVGPEEIIELGRLAAVRNRDAGLTGVLLCLQDTFFQVLEGGDEALDRLYEAICRDPRHTDVVCLGVEKDISSRIFPDWSMRTIDLDRRPELLLHPVKLILTRLAQTHRIIERYTQPILRRILAAGTDPSTLQPQRVRRVILFADLLAFSSLAERAPVELVVPLLNRFFDLATSAVAAQGGEVTKFIGDCILASFPDDGADAAVQAALDLLSGLSGLRREAVPGSWGDTLYCGVGLTRGEVIEGNIGSRLKLDFTLIGDVVNAAQRLEGLTRQFGKALVASEPVRLGCSRTWPWMPLGELVVKGKDAPVTAFTLDHPLLALPDIEVLKESYLRHQPLSP